MLFRGLFFPDTVYKRYASNEPNSNNTCHSGQLSLLPFVDCQVFLMHAYSILYVITLFRNAANSASYPP